MEKWNSFWDEDISRAIFVNILASYDHVYFTIPSLGSFVGYSVDGVQ